MSTCGMSYEFINGPLMPETKPTGSSQETVFAWPKFQTKTSTPESLTETLNLLLAEGCQIHTIYVSKTYGSSGSRSA